MSRLFGSFRFAPLKAPLRRGFCWRGMWPSIFARPEPVRMTAAVLPGQVVYYPSVGFPGGCGVGSLPGTSTNIGGFARGSRGRFRLLYPLLPLQLLRGPLISTGWRMRLCISAIASGRSRLSFVIGVWRFSPSKTQVCVFVSTSAC